MRDSVPTIPARSFVHMGVSLVKVEVLVTAHTTPVLFDSHGPLEMCGACQSRNHGRRWY